MKSEKLLELIGGIDDELIATADGAKVQPWVKWGAAVAAAVVIFGIGAALLIAGRTHTSPAPLTVPEYASGTQITGTSEEYSSLNELLAYLSHHDYHSDDSLAEGAKGSRSAAGSSYTEGTNAVVVNGHACHASDEGIIISRLDGANVTEVSRLYCTGGRLFAYNNLLIVVSEEDISENELDYQLNQHISIFDLSYPAEPVLVFAASQSGSHCGSFISDDTLWLLSSDGECACGYSRLEDKSEYIPEIVVNGDTVELTDDRLHVLGEPSMVRYLAVTGLQLAPLKLGDVQVFYGDIDSVFHGEEYVALEVQKNSDKYVFQPEIYVFGLGDGVSYSGKISTAAVLGIPQSVRPSSNGAQRFELTAFSRYDGNYRLTGTLYTNDGQRGISRLAAISVAEDFSGHLVGLSEEFPSLITVTETLDEDGRQIICYSTYTEDYSQAGHFGFALYGEDVSIVTPALDTDHMDGIDMIMSYSSPYGEFSTLIPMGNGIYLRYCGSPDRIAAYDLSDSRHPVVLNESSVQLDEMQRFTYEHHLYGDEGVGAVVITPGIDDEGEYNYRDRYITCEYVVYDYQSDSNSLIESACYQIEGYEQLCVLEHNGSYYCVVDGCALPVAVG